MSIVVDTASLRDLAAYSNGISSAIGSSATSIRAIKSSLPSKVLSKGGISSSFNSVCSRVDSAQERVARLSAFLTTAANEYSETEQKIITQYAAGTLDESGTQQTAGGNVKIAGTANDILGEVGFLGNIIAFFTKPFATWIDSGKFPVAETGAKSVVSILKDGNSALKGLWEWQQSNNKLDKLARMWPAKAKELRKERLLGLTKVNRLFENNYASTAESWTVRFKNNFSDLTKDGPFKSYTSGGAKAAFAWAGLAFSLASNTVSNIKEAKSGEISTGRAVAETVVETAVDVTKGWVIAAGVTAAIAAIPGAAAAVPVVVVGAATVAVSWVADWACKKITGAIGGEEKGLTETVSDFVLDVGEAAIAEGKKVVSSVSSFVKSGWSRLSSSVGRGFSPLFST